MKLLDDYSKEIKAWSDHESEVAKILASWCMVNFDPASVLDLGCGSGIFLKPYQEQGRYVMGVDGDKTGGSEISKFQQLDLRYPIFIGRFELTICLEVIEHLQPQYENVLLDTLVNSSDLILFSGAKPNQIGTHHYNCQSKDYWKGHMAARGFRVNSLTDKLTDYMESHEEFKQTPWLVENIVIFEKKS